MASRWQVDPESKSKLTALQALPPNKTCIDCGAPSPQWASPKFGTFICLTCAGLHRSLGVHISFVRSIAMDSFKPSETLRMEKGGNAAWRAFWSSKHPAQTWPFPGKGGDEAAKRRVEDTYGGDVGEEWKERLSCLVEEREFMGMPEKVKKREVESAGFGGVGVGAGAGARSQKEMNESYFAKKGQENAHRPEGLKPSEGGKYAGFGSGPPPTEQSSGGADDPLATISKGWGWFSGQAAKVGKNVYDSGSFAAQKIAEADLAAQARQAALAAQRGLQTGTKSASSTFNNFVDPSHPSSASKRAEPEKKDFWDSFGEAPKEPEKKDFWDSFGKEEGGGSVGTAAMKKGGSGGEGKKGGWDDW